MLTLDEQTVLKATMFAARRRISLSALLGEQIEAFVEREETYDRAKAQALALLDKGFHLGGRSPVNDRSELHLSPTVRSPGLQHFIHMPE